MRPGPSADQKRRMNAERFGRGRLDEEFGDDVTGAPSRSPERHEYAVGDPAQNGHLPRRERTPRDQPPPVAQGPFAVARVVEVDRVERPVPVLDGRVDLAGR